MHESSTTADPTPGQLRAFAAMVVVFFGLLGVLAAYKPGGLALAAGVTGAAWLTSLAFNRGISLRRQAPGLIIPLTLAGLALLGRADAGATAAFAFAVPMTAGCLLAAGAWLAPRFGRGFYIRWIDAAMPIGWTIAILLLGLIYFGLFTPMGLGLRLAGYDPMQRQPDRAAKSYWIPHEPVKDLRRYYRQY